MNIPGFTAERSVSCGRGQYWSTVGFGTSSAADRLSMQASPIVFARSLGRVTDVFPRIRCCNQFGCVEWRASPLENCRSVRDLPGLPVILCRGPVIGPPE